MDLSAFYRREKTAMHGCRISKSERIAVCVMGIMMLFVVLFSSFFVAYEADHDCTGEDCPVCACIAQCENTLRQISVVMSFLITLVLPATVLFQSVCLSVAFITQNTPVSSKVRLNN